MIVWKVFAWCQAVGVGWIKAEFLPAILQRKAAVRQYHPRTEAVVVALNERHHVALGIGRRQIHCATGVWITRRGRLSLIADQRPARVAVTVAQQVSHGHAHVIWIGDVVQAVAVRQLHGLQLPVPGQLTVAMIEREALQYLQGHQGDQALAAGRDLPDVVAAITDADGVDPLRTKTRQVFSPQIAAGCAGVGVESLCQCAAIKALAFSRCQLFQGARLSRVAKQLPGLRRATVDEERLKPAVHHGIAVGTELLERDLPLVSNHRRQRKPVAGQADRRL